MATAEVVIRQPQVALRRYVERYVGYRLEGYPAGVHRGLPSRFLTFIVRLDEPSAIVAGLHTSAVLLPHQGEHHGIAIELTVRGARALFGTPSGALTANVADVSDLLGRGTSPRCSVVRLACLRVSFCGSCASSVRVASFGRRHAPP